MDFDANKMPIEVIKEVPFSGAYFKNIYCSINGKWCKKSWREFDHLKNIDQKFHCSDYYDVSVNKHGVERGTSFTFWGNKG